MAPPTPTSNPFTAMRNFGGMVSSALSLGDRSRQVSSLGLGALSLGEPSGDVPPPRSASPPAGPPAGSPSASPPPGSRSASPPAGSRSASPPAGSRSASPPAGSRSASPPAATPRRMTPAFRRGESPSSSDQEPLSGSESDDQSDSEGNGGDDDDEDDRIVSEGETELEEHSDDDMVAVSVEDNDGDSPEFVRVSPPAQIVGQKRPRALSSSSSSSSSSSGVLPPANAIAAAASAAARRPVAAARPAVVPRPAVAAAAPVAAAAAAAAPPSSPRGEPSPKRAKRSLREEEYLWKKLESEPGRWVAVGVDEACDRCRREIITYNRPNWPCLKAVRPHNKALRCASCTSGPCSFCPVSSARDIPPRPSDSSPFPPPQTPASVPRSRVPPSSLRSVRRTLPDLRPSPPSPSPFAPVAGPSRLPAVPPSSSRRPSASAPSASRPSASRPSAPRPSSPVVASPPAHSTRSRRPSVPPATSAAPPVTPPSASQKTPKSSLKKSKGKSKEKEVAFNDGDVEGEDTQRVGPSAPRLSLVHPRISLDVRIPEDEKEFTTYRSLVLGLTTQLEAARNDTSLLLDFSSRQANALNNLTAALVDVVNTGALDDGARTRLADVSRRSLTEIADVRRRLFDTPFLVTPMAYEPPPSLDWLGRRSSSRVPASAQTALDLLSLPFECLRTIRSLWRTPSMQAARDVQDFGDFFGAMNRAWNASLSTAFPSETLDLPSVIGSLHTNPAGPSRFVHPRISLDVRIPEDEKEFTTYRSLVLGLTTQLEAARNGYISPA
ncbi:hypothetical protein TREMEDRAFT_61046 [Tremella mesenterica DSM 1558]|uniref:uncharacterized protein n=1 Tax=Tremella mesenterica (strain ATCC 24925 / CBS 8224 / DSM 1558 / NBRC 9311 / NRRL Y-6157 / RJB 2259-6 / UBC 559-6) TaxID=578456 RepID=UPI0003F4A3E6|nr:uncharacterized protein TREMEDRAFT_61046 [Tremella mesenterica DSM 1558]EIW70540.1 hypothetical protein TREMEDRAFT_61046 [Tremella mesenterica DSM 1558]